MTYKAKFEIKQKGETPLKIKGNPEAVMRRATRLITRLSKEYKQFDKQITQQYQNTDRKKTRKLLENIFGKQELQKIMETK